MNPGKGEQVFFTENLMEWHRNENQRILPWKQEKDPYKIWLSEVILQQTRAEQGIPYYLKFLKAYPNVHALAAAPDEAVFRLWQGLGYYNRCKNLLAAARVISGTYDGEFPETYEGLLQLKGVGAYTASAIASFAFGLPYAVLDGNVNRVLARFFGEQSSFSTSEGKKKFQELAEKVLDKTDSAGYNQAIMDFGATVCTPQNPKCRDCPLKEHCFAFRKDLVPFLPVKIKKQPVRKRYFHYLVFKSGGRIWIQKRTGKDIWQNLHEPFLVEHDGVLRTEDIRNLSVLKNQNVRDISYGGFLKQRLSHQLIETHFFEISTVENIFPETENGGWREIGKLKNLAFPKSILSFFEKKFYF